MFFILVHSDFYGMPLPDHVSNTNTQVNNFSKRTRYYEHSFSKKRRSAIVKSEKDEKWRITVTKSCASTVKDSITNKMNA
jgi:hypothetical protein